MIPRIVTQFLAILYCTMFLILYIIRISSLHKTERRTYGTVKTVYHDRCGSIEKGYSIKKSE